LNHNTGRQNEPTDSQMQLGIKIGGTRSMLLCNNVTSLRTRSQVVRNLLRNCTCRYGTFTL